MANVQITLNVSRSFHKMLKKIAGGIGRTVEDCLLRSIVSTVEAVQAGEEDPALVVGGLPEIDCDPQLLALAMDIRKKSKPFLSSEEIRALEQRFSTATEVLEMLAPPIRQAMGGCRIIDFNAWKRSRLR